MKLVWTIPTEQGCGKPTKTYLRVYEPTYKTWVDVETLSGSATTASFNYQMWVDSDGYVKAGIITENEAGTSGGFPKIYDTKNKKWL